MNKLKNRLPRVTWRLGCLLAAVCASVAAAAQADEPVVMGYDRLRQLVLDTRVVLSLDNAKMTPGRVVKEPRGALFTADRPWENATNNLYPNVWFDSRERLFKLWYKCVLHDADVIARMDGPTTIHEQGWYLLYATSPDGLSWAKPELGLHSFDGSKKTNIVTRDTPNAGVMFDAHDPDASRRFKMIYDVGLGKLRTRFSADGVRWSEPVEPQGFASYNGDTHNNAFWDERLQKYVLFSRTYVGERLVARLESDDFFHWKPTGIVMRSSPTEGRVTQTYCMPAFAYGNVYFGYLMMYHPGRDRAVDCELAWSPDSITWHRVSPGQPLIPRGERGSGDAMCIYGPAGPAIAQDGRLLIFYGGSDEPHLGWKRHCLPMLARLPVDGFVGCEPLDHARPAILTTQPMLVSDEPLTVSAANGTLRVRVLDAENFSSEPSDPITHSGADQRVTFPRRDQKTLRGQIVRLQFELDRATLFGFRGLSQLATPAHDTGVRRFDDSLTVKLIKSADAESATLRFTLDGREPTRDSDEPTIPLKLTSTTRLRSRLFWPGATNGGPESDTTFVRREPPKTPASIITEADSFDENADGWIGIDAIAHHRDGGLHGGFVRLTRANPHKPFAQLSLDQRRYAGDWPKHFGGEGATISFALRGDSRSGKARVEIFAGDTGAWTNEFSPTPGPEWQTWSTTIRWDWNDAEAEAAGWTRTLQSCSWSDTLRHAGRIVVMPSVASQVSSFDLDDFSVTTWPTGGTSP